MHCVTKSSNKESSSILYVSRYETLKINRDEFYNCRSLLRIKRTRNAIFTIDSARKFAIVSQDISAINRKFILCHQCPLTKENLSLTAKKIQDARRSNEEHRSFFLINKSIFLVSF